MPIRLWWMSIALSSETVCAGAPLVHYRCGTEAGHAGATGLVCETVPPTMHTASRQERQQLSGHEDQLLRRQWQHLPAVRFLLTWLEAVLERNLPLLARQ
jgi:hypothetical protein